MPQQKSIIRRPNCFVLWIVAFVVAHANSALAAGSDRPILQIEAGAHTTLVQNLAVSSDPDQKWLASASKDKTVRIWTLPKLELVHTIHLPIGPEAEGAALSVDFSPDGKWLAASGYTGLWSKDGLCIYVIDTGDWEIQQQPKLCNLKNRAFKVRFTPDGQYLVAAINTGSTQKGAGLSVYRTSDWSVYRSYEYGDAAVGLDFDRKSGRTVTVSLDGYIRLYDSDFKQIAQRRAPDCRKPSGAGCRKPEGVAFSPDGTKIAVGYAESDDKSHWAPLVTLLSALDLSALAQQPSMDGIDDDAALWAVAWSADGQYLYGAGTWQRGLRYRIRRWSGGGEGVPDDTGSANLRGEILALRTTRYGIAVSTDSGSIALLDQNNEFPYARPSPTADFSDIGDSLKVSNDGTAIEFKFNGADDRVMYFSLKDQILISRMSSDSSHMNKPVQNSPTLKLVGWYRRYAPTLYNGAHKFGLKLKRYGDKVDSMTFLPKDKNGKEGFLLGTSWMLIRYDSQGNVVWEHDANTVDSVTVTPDGRIAVAALGDGTIRWYDITPEKKGQELMAFYSYFDPTHPDDNRWVAWTPDGYYVDSADGASLIAWQIDRGHFATTESHPFDQFPQYRRPDVIRSLLASGDENRAVREAALESGRPAIPRAVDVVTSQRPPEITIKHSQRDDVPGVLDVLYQVHGPAGNPVEIQPELDGGPLNPFTAPELDASGEAEEIHKFTVPDDDMTLTLQPSNRFGKGQATSLHIAGTGTSSLKPHIAYVLAIGVAKFDKPDFLPLEHADKDAEDFLAALNEQVGASKAFTKVNAYPADHGATCDASHGTALTNEQATLTNILDGLAWLTKCAGKDDVAILFLSGHGGDQDSTYYYAAYDAVEKDLNKTALSGDKVQSALTALKQNGAYPILFVDTCHAEDVTDDTTRLAQNVAGVVDSLRRNRIIYYYSSLATENSQEVSGYPNGAFTWAVIQEMRLGKMRFPNSDDVTVNDMQRYVTGEVSLITHKQQTAYGSVPPGIDLMLARIVDQGGEPVEPAQ